MQTTFKLILPCLFCLALLLVSGCGNNAGNDGGTSGDSGSRTSSQSKDEPKKDVPSDKELNDVVKRGLNREVLADKPLEITDVSVNWTDKTDSMASGKFSVKTKTTEKLYKSVDNKDGLRILGISDFYEGELNIAKDKISNLPEPHKTNLRNAVPQGRTDSFRFYDVLVPTGGEVTVTGSIELTKYGSDWQSDRLRVNSFSVENYTPESELRDAHKLDDSKTKEAINAVIQERKNFVAKVDETVAEVEQQRQAAAAEAERIRLAEIKRQQDALDAQYNTILEYVKPGAKYEGTWTCSRWGAQSAGITVVFGEYNGNKTAIDGTYYLTGYPDAWVAFRLNIKPDKIEQLPIKGQRGDLTSDAKVANDQRRRDDKQYDEVAGSFFHYSMSTINMGIVNGKLIGTFASDTKVDLGKPK